MKTKFFLCVALFFAIGQGFSPIMVGLSLAASITSAATFIINPGFVAFYGWSVLIVKFNFSDSILHFFR